MKHVKNWKYLKIIAIFLSKKILNYLFYCWKKLFIKNPRIVYALKPIVKSIVKILAFSFFQSNLIKENNFI